VLKRRLLVAVALLAALAAGYHFWLRDSSLVAVESVTVRVIGTLVSLATVRSIPGWLRVVLLIGFPPRWLPRAELGTNR